MCIAVTEVLMARSARIIAVTEFLVAVSTPTIAVWEPIVPMPERSEGANEAHRDWSYHGIFDEGW